MGASLRWHDMRMYITKGSKFNRTVMGESRDQHPGKLADSTGLGTFLLIALQAFPAYGKTVFLTRTRVFNDYCKYSQECGQARDDVSL